MVKKAAEARPNHLLRAARKQRGWTQKGVADRIGAPLSLNITRWERGTATPSAHYVEQLYRLFGKSPQELGLLPLEEEEQQQEQASEPQRPWNVPFNRNPFFTGRDELLLSLRERLGTQHVAAITQSQALTGLGGIGKTQTAIEYAYRYRDDYRAVFWARAANRETLIADYVALGSLVQIPGQDAQDQNTVVATVKRWLIEHPGWLLILDNADDLPLIPDFLPTGGTGHVLLTTRAQATGQLAASLAVEKMAIDEGTLLLLHRAKLLPPQPSLDEAPAAARAQAGAIVVELDGLPLALDQAGAYIEETGCRLAEYLQLYQRRRGELLKRQSSVPSAYPHTVASTWSLSFQQVQQANPAAADLLRLCAFLNPDVIPESIVIDGAAVLGPTLAPVGEDSMLLNEAISVLRRYSLVKRDAEAKLLNMHRLVQTILKDNMDAETRRQWAERVVRAINATFPEVVFENWAHCELCLPQALVCAGLIEQHKFSFPEAARLLDHAGSYLRDRALYGQAMPLLQRALAICELALGPEHPQTAFTLNNLAQAYYLQGHYDQAEPLLQRALTICEHTLGPEHLDIASVLYQLQWLYYLEGKYESAEPLAHRTLAIREKALGPDHPDTADALSDVATLYQAQGKYELAEPLYERAVAIKEHTLEPGHPDIADVLSGLALIYNLRGKYDQAEPLYQRVLAINEHTKGPDHPNVALALRGLAFLYGFQGKYDQAEPLHQRALAIYEHTQGPDHPDVARTLNHLAWLCNAQGRYEQAESLYQRALAIFKQALGPDHPDTGRVLNNLAEVYHAQARYEQAEPLYQQALAIMEQALGPEHPYIAHTLYNLARLCEVQAQYERAQPFYQRALAIREKMLGPEHPDTVAIFKHYHGLLRKLQPAAEITRQEERE